jgi:CRISPR/Cas system CMR-associated protein Cmr3 (group 5 of RAMP superfamily)
MTDNALDRTKAYLISESRVSKEISITSLLNYLKIQKMTAHVTIQVNQGGVREVIVTEKKEVEGNPL